MTPVMTTGVRRNKIPAPRLSACHLAAGQLGVDPEKLLAGVAQSLRERA
jgi:hypothetical protein